MVDSGKLKETQMRNIRSGQPVKIKIDMFPSLRLIGTVESLGASSGVTFFIIASSKCNWQLG